LEEVSVIRNFFTVFGIFSIFAVFFFFIRPDWIKEISSSPHAQNVGAISKVTARLASERLTTHELTKEGGGVLQIDPLPTGEDVSAKIVEEVGDDLPSRNSSFLLVVNKSSNTMRYCQLSQNVKKVMVRGVLPPDVKFQEVTTTSGGPYQVVIWAPNAIDVPLEIELMMAPRARSLAAK
jgi:hypothetical protein